jgi:hypothetical protein
MITWSGPLVLVEAADVVVPPDRSDAKGFRSDFQMASPKQIAATITMPAMAMTMSFLKFAPADVWTRIAPDELARVYNAAKPERWRPCRLARRRPAADRNIR